MRVAVVGGGISGLAAAHFLAGAGHDLVCIEPVAPAGGVLRSERQHGFLCETGPQALLDGAPETRRLIAELGLAERVLSTLPSARRRLLYRAGQLQPLPTSPPALLRSKLLSLGGKLRLLAEPFVRRPRTVDEDETVLAFATRRFGSQVAQRLVAPAVIGIYAADADSLAVQTALPKLAALERAYGSVLRGAIAARRKGAGAGQTVSFPEGLQELAAAITARLGDRLIAGEVTALERRGSTWAVTVANRSGTVDADAVVVAASASASARLLEPLAPQASAALRAVPHAPAAVVSLGFDGADTNSTGMDLDAYGFIVPRGEGVELLLGCQYETSIFAGRGPAGSVLLRAILGGTFHPELVDRPDATIADAAVADLRRVAGLRRDPSFVRVWRHAAGLPQYRPGHARLVAAANNDLGRHPGLHLLGQTLYGVGVNDCIHAAAQLASRFAA
jgi:oxygen-dependent protoporphyrinogen oxidase